MRKIITTKDGSTTIELVGQNEQYHSKHGAIAEANHVFINSGLKYFLDTNNSQQIHVLEVGFGTGLNALLTCNFAQKNSIKIDYLGLEAFPPKQQEVDLLNYDSLVNKELFAAIHQTNWNEWQQIFSHFNLKKKQVKLQDYQDHNQFDLVFFDAFGPRTQPEMWTLEMLQKIYSALKENGIFVTYSCKGEVRRNLAKLGFDVEKISGPPGKREMLRAIKPAVKLC
ncbi:MAG: tRNA (5-methylaminomethyl-2-thiouridine)(34)-methyltransferase MnmD [Bacteroidota bacterium]